MDRLPKDSFRARWNNDKVDKDHPRRRRDITNEIAELLDEILNWEEFTYYQYWKTETVIIDCQGEELIKIGTDRYNAEEQEGIWQTIIIINRL